MLSGCKLFVCLAGTRRSWLSTKDAAFLFALRRNRQDLRPIKASLWPLYEPNFVVCKSVRCPCKVFACLADTRRSCLPTKTLTFLFALHLRRQGSLTKQSKLVADLRSKLCRLSSGRGGCKLFACLAGTRRSCLPTKAAGHPLCFALEPSGISDQASKLVAARRCVANANCLPVWPALAGAACQQRLPPSSSLLCT